MDWHPFAVAAVPAIVGALIPQVRDRVGGWFWRRWDNRPAAQRARIAVALIALEHKNEQLDQRVRAHLVNEEMQMVADRSERVDRQDGNDAEFRAIDSRFERVEGRLDAVHDTVARLAGAVEVLIGQGR